MCAKTDLLIFSCFAMTSTVYLLFCFFLILFLHTFFPFPFFLFCRPRSCVEFLRDLKSCFAIKGSRKSRGARKGRLWKEKIRVQVFIWMAACTNIFHSCPDLRWSNNALTGETNRVRDGTEGGAGASEMLVKCLSFVTVFQQVWPFEQLICLYWIDTLQV